MEEILIKNSKRGSRKITGTAYHAVSCELIEVIEAATFTRLTEPGAIDKFLPGASTEDGASVRQVDTMTLTGTEGTANITYNGLTAKATFATSPTQTATNFAAAQAVAFAAVGVLLTASGATLLFTAPDAGYPLVGAPSIVNTDGDLAGTVATTTANKQTPLGLHGISGEQPAGTLICAKTTITGIQLSAGIVSCY